MKTHLALLLCPSLALAVLRRLQPGDPPPISLSPTSTARNIRWPTTRANTSSSSGTTPECPFVRKQYESGNMPKAPAGRARRRASSGSPSTPPPPPPGRSLPANQIEKFLPDNHADPTAYLRDPDGTVGHLYGAKTTPHMFVINPDGKLIYEAPSTTSPRRTQPTSRRHQLRPCRAG